MTLVLTTTIQQRNHYPTEELQKEDGLEVKRKSIKRVLVADGHVNKGKQQVELPFLKDFQQKSE